MQQLLFIETASSVGVKDNCLALKIAEDQIQLIHPNDVLAVVVENIYCQFSIPALLLCVEQQIPVLICNQKHQPQIYCLDHYRHSELLQRLTQQINWSDAQKKKAWISIIHSKLQHQMELLKYYKGAAETIQSIENYQSAVTIDSTIEQINTAESISARMYFTALFGNSFKRFAEDSINHGLNYGYAIIRGLIMVALTVKGLHPSLGVWHCSVRNRFNLADDMIETLRPLVDFTVKQLNLEPSQSLTKEHRIQLLMLAQSQVLYQQKNCSLKQAINLYIDDFISFMSHKSDILSTMKVSFSNECD